MGNRKKKTKDYRGRHDGADDEMENASVMSVVSDGSVQNESEEGAELDAGSAGTSNFAAEDTFTEALDGLSLSRSTSREKSLGTMKKLLQMKSLSLANVINKNYETLSDALTSCVKRGKNNEVILAANCLSLSCVHLVNLVDCDVEKFYLTHLKPVLRQILTDDSFNPVDRAAIAASLGLACYSCSDDSKDVQVVMSVLEGIFFGSALKGDGAVRQVSAPLANLHNSALQSWAILFSRDCVYVNDSTLVKLKELLHSPHVDLRISAGETLALVYEMRRQSIENYRLRNHRDLCEHLKSMAHDGHKSKAKRDLKLQRSSFRDIAIFIERSQAELEVETIKIDKNDLLEISSWADRLMYHVLCGVFGSGIKIQLQENGYIREHIFGLNPWVPDTLPQDKTMKNEIKRSRRLDDQARFLARSKGRSKRLASISSQ